MNKHCCCICERDGLFKEVLIHHIDGNNSNNKSENLAVLCLNHASMADAGLRTGKLGSGKKLTPAEVKEYKKRWETKVGLTSNLQKRTFPLYQKKHLQILHQYEINKIKNEILSLNDKDKRLKEKFTYFDQLVIEEWMTDLPLRKFLLKAYDELIIPGWIIEDVNKSKLLAKSISSLFSHLGDPTLIPMNKSEKKLLTKGLEALETFASFAGQFSPNISPLKNACNAILELAEIALLYNLKDVKRKILRLLNKIEKDCSEYESEKKTKLVTQERLKRVTIVETTIRKVNSLK